MSDAPPKLRMPRRKPDPQRVQVDRDSELQRQLRALPLVQRWFERTEGGTGHQLVAQRKYQLSQSLRVTQGISPYLWDVLAAVRRLLSIEGRVELYVEPSPVLNAFCMPLPDHGLLVVVTSGAVQQFSKRELLFVLGHEIGHGLLGHYQFPAMAMLSPMDEDTRLPWKVCVELYRWSRASEVSADRFGLLCCQDVRSATRAFLKLASGLTDVHLGEADDYDAQMEEWSAAKVAGEGMDHSHPLLPIRIACLRSFSESDYLLDLLGHDGVPPKYELAEADRHAGEELARMDAEAEEIEGLDLDEDSMIYAAMAGLLLIAADNEISSVEYHWLSQLVGEPLADEVREWAGQNGMEGLCEGIAGRGPEVAQRLGRQGCFELLERLAALVAVDGQVHPDEVRGIGWIAKTMGLPSTLADVAIRNVRGEDGTGQSFA